MIKQLPFVEAFNDFGNFIEVRLKDGFKVNDLLKAVLDRVEIFKVETRRSTLHEIFISLVKGGENDA